MREKRTVAQEGTRAGSLVRGIAKSNQGIRIQVTQEQSRGSIGAIQGSFVILDLGDNPHSEALRPLLNKTTNALEVLQLQRSGRSSCISVAVVHHLECES
jgi:hypothetical protein